MVEEENEEENRTHETMLYGFISSYLKDVLDTPCGEYADDRDTIFNQTSDTTGKFVFFFFVFFFN
jgi:hypothetical protein